jgi:hypothetical protein
VTFCDSGLVRRSVARVRGEGFRGILDATGRRSDATAVNHMAPMLIWEKIA